MMMNRMRLMEKCKNQLRRLLFVMKNSRRSGGLAPQRIIFVAKPNSLFKKTVFPRSQLSVFNNIRLHITCLTPATGGKKSGQRKIISHKVTS